MIKKARSRSAAALDSVVDAHHGYLADQNKTRLTELGLDSWTQPSPFVEDPKRPAVVFDTGAPLTRDLRSRASALKKASPWPKGAKRRGRPPGKVHSPEHWQRIAEMYREADRAGRNPTKEIYERLIEAGDDVAYSTVATWIARCRQMGMLPKTTKGKAKA
jgi:hypothetical protein